MSAPTIFDQLMREDCWQAIDAQSRRQLAACDLELLGEMEKLVFKKVCLEAEKAVDQARIDGLIREYDTYDEIARQLGIAIKKDWNPIRDWKRRGIKKLVLPYLGVIPEEFCSDEVG